MKVTDLGHCFRDYSLPDVALQIYIYVTKR